MVVEAEIEDGVHHAGHGELCAGADGDQQGILGGAESLALQLFEAGEGGVHLSVDLGAEGAEHVLAAGFGLDGESWGDGQSGIGHLGEAGAFSAEHVLHAAVALGVAAAEEVHILGWGDG